MLRTCLALVFCASAASAQEAPAELIQKGLAAYQARQYTEAREHFVKIEPTTSHVLHNLALTHLQLNQKPWAVAYWRKALAMEPTFSPARAGRDLMEGKMGMRPWERDPFSLGLRHFLESISLVQLLWVLALLIGASGYLWINYVAERRSALRDERAMPAPPWVAGLMSVILALGVGLLQLKWSDASTQRATIIADRASVRSLPTDDGVQLFELSGGFEVVLRQTQGEWSQVQSREGSSGWVKNADILVSDRGR